MLQRKLTYNSVRNRIRNTCKAHKLINSFYFARYEDLVEEKNFNYPCIFVQSKGGTISQGRHESSIDFRMFVLDRTFVSMDSTDNEADVISDTIGIAEDIVSQLVRMGNVNTDMQLSITSNFEILLEKDSDVTAGIYFDFTIRILFYQNVCAVPSDIPIDPGEDMKEVYDIIWLAPDDILQPDDSFPGIFSFTVPGDVIGKKVLHVVRSNYPLFKTTAVNFDNSPSVQSNEYYFDGSSITYGTAIMPGERTLILYRVY